MNVRNLLNTLVNAFRNGSTRKGYVRRGLAVIIAVVVALCALVSPVRADSDAMMFVGYIIWQDDGWDHSADDAKPVLTLYRTTSKEQPSSPTQGDGVEVVEATPTWPNMTYFMYTNLPVSDSDGNPYRYWVVETLAGGKYDKYETTYLNNDVYEKLGEESSPGDRLLNGGTIKNSIRQIKVDIEGTVTWEHGENSEHPKSVTVYLQANGVDGYNARITLNGTSGDGGESTSSDYKELQSEDGVWKYRFGNQDKYKYDADNNSVEELNYTVRVEPVPNYKPTYDESKRNITNTYNPNTRGDILRVSKTVDGETWDQGEDDKFAFGLFSVGNDAGVLQPMPVGSVYGDEVYKLIEATNGDPNPTFGPISFDTPGTYVYSVRELTPAETGTNPLPGMSYDTEIYTVTFVVDDNLNIAPPTITNKNGESISQSDGVFTLPFNNHFNASEVNYVMVADMVYVDCSQLDEVGHALDAIGKVGGKFRFTLRPVGGNAAEAPMPSSSTGSGADRVYYANNVNNLVLFGEDAENGIKFDAGHQDTYTYEIAEIIPDDAVYIGDGFWYNDDDETVYDGVVHKRKLTVSKDNGVLTVTSGPCVENKIFDPEKGTKYSDANEAQIKSISEQQGYPRHRNNVPLFYNYKEPKISVTATKVWDDANNQDGKRPTKVIFCLDRSDGLWLSDVYGTNVYNDVPIAGTNLKEFPIEHMWSNLPRYKRLDNGTYEQIDYQVHEYADGRNSGIKSVPGYAEQVITGDVKNGFTITNKRYTDLRGVSVTKQWDDAYDKDRRRPDRVTFHLDREGGDPATAVSDFRDPIVANEASGWTATWLDLPAHYGDSTKEYNYVLREDDIANYTAGNYVEDKASIRVQIAPEEKRTKSVTVALTENGKVTDKTIELNAANNWTGTFDRVLSWSEENGYRQYGVVVACTGTGVDDGDLQKTVIRNYTFTNTHVPGKASLTATREWADEDNKDRLRADVTLHLMRKVGESGTWERMDSSYDRVIELDGSSVTWPDLPTYSGDKFIEYKVEEDALPGYEVSYGGDMIYGLTVTNTHRPGEISANVRKIWDDNDNAKGLRPKSVSMHLIAHTEGDWAKDMGALDADAPRWQVFWSNMPTQHNGREINYDVFEEAVDGYYVSNTWRDDTYLEITNTITEPVDKVTATLIRHDANNQDGKRTPVTMRLERSTDGGASWKPATAGEGSAMQVRSGEGAWRAVDFSAEWQVGVSDDAENQVQWTGLPMTAATGLLGMDDGAKGEVIYRVVEVPGSGSERCLVRSVGLGAFELVSIHTPETLDFQVRKVWDDDDNANGERPASVSVRLLADGQPLEGQVAELSGANDWTNSWSDLPRYAEGKEIVYSAEEVEVPARYTAIGATDDTNGYVITNIYSPLISITAEKLWEKSDGAPLKVGSGIETPDVYLQLYRSVEGSNERVAVGEPKVIPSAANASEAEMRATWEDLPSVVDGKRVTYAVEETIEEGGSLGARQFGVNDTIAKDGRVVFTNRLLPDPESNLVAVFGQKSWNDDNNARGTRPESITIRLMADGKEIDSRQVTSEDGWKWNFGTFDKVAADGHEIRYEIGEDDVEGYDQTISGFDVMNSLKSSADGTQRPMAAGPGATAKTPQTGDPMSFGAMASLLALGSALSISGCGFALHRRHRWNDDDEDKGTTGKVA